LELSDLRGSLRAALETGAFLQLHNRTKAIDIPLKTDITARQLQLLLAGGLLNYTKERGGC
jgi:aconitate hydratase